MKLWRGSFPSLNVVSFVDVFGRCGSQRLYVIFFRNAFLMRGREEKRGA